MEESELIDEYLGCQYNIFFSPAKGLCWCVTVYDGDTEIDVIAHFYCLNSKEEAIKAAKEHIAFRRKMQMYASMDAEHDTRFAELLPTGGAATR